MLRTTFLFLLIYSCNDVKNIDTIIGKEKLTDILVDIHLIEAKYENLKFKEEFKANAVLKNDYDSIFNIYNINFEEFKYSLSYYAEKNDELERIYNNALEKLKKEKLKLD